MSPSRIVLVLVVQTLRWYSRNIDEYRLFDKSQILFSTISATQYKSTHHTEVASIAPSFSPLSLYQDLKLSQFRHVCTCGAPMRRELSPSPYDRSSSGVRSPLHCILCRNCSMQWATWVSDNISRARLHTYQCVCP